MVASWRRTPVVDPPLLPCLYLDEDVHKRVATALRLRHFDVVSAHETEHWGLTDEEQLAYAASQGRAILTFNTADFIALHLEWLDQAREPAGIVVSDQIVIGEAGARPPKPA